jgi:RNA-binding protein 25
MFGGVSIMPTKHVTIKKTMIKQQKSIQPINQLFQDEEEEQMSQLKKQRIDSEERKRAVKKLVESIPVDRDELFAYNIDWTQLDSTLMDKRIKPWINKKIIEYIGEEEATLNDFICSKIQQQARPEKLLEEIKVVLDEEAEMFVTKMWRLIVYETESKRCGLSK